MTRAGGGGPSSSIGAKESEATQSGWRVSRRWVQLLRVGDLPGPGAGMALDPP